MTLLRKLAWVLCWAFLFTSYSNSQQIDTTGNLVNPGAWNNAVYQNNLTCWSQGDPGYCGPLPIVNSGGGINFSYGTTDLYQLKTIAAALPNSGTGLVVNGFNFAFMAKNGNGWDDGRQDFLSAYVKFYTTKGTAGPEYDYTAATNRQYNWTPFNFSETFASPWPVPELSSVKYGFVGRDNNYWQGPYGPEVYNVSFSLKYSVDPCSKNSFYSPSCAGYFDALAKLAPLSTSSVASYSLPPPPPPADNSEPPAGQKPPQQDPQAQSNPPPPPGSPPPPGAPPPPGPQQQTVQQTAPASTPAGPQEKSGGTPANLSFALSLIAKNSEREKATAQQVVAAAEAQAQAAGDRAQQTAQQTASTSVAQSTQSTEIAFSGTGLQASGPQTRNTVITTTVQQQASTAIVLSAQSFVAVSSTQQNLPIQLQVPITAEQPQNIQNSSVFSVQEYKQQEFEQVTQTASFLTDLNSPLKQILDAQQMQQAEQPQPQQSQPRDTTTNELATGVNLQQIALVPQGYANYTNFALRDANFYEPREVYKNQRVVDNVRVLRGLGSDQKHQDLVNLQYK